MSTTPENPQLTEPQFSFAKLVLFSLGTGVLVLLISIPIILVVGQWSPIAGLIVALIALVVMVAGIAVVSRRMMANFERDVHAYRAQTEPS